MTVHVCPIKDIVCGDRPENWCEGCSKRPAIAAHAQAQPVVPDSWQVLVNGKWVQTDKFEHDLALEEGRTSRALYAAPQPAPQPEPIAAERYSTVQDGGTQVDYVKAQPEPTSSQRHNLATYLAANYSDAQGDTTDEKAINALDKMDVALGMKELPDKPTAQAQPVVRPAKPMQSRRMESPSQQESKDEHRINEAT